MRIGVGGKLRDLPTGPATPRGYASRVCVAGAASRRSLGTGFAEKRIYAWILSKVAVITDRIEPLHGAAALPESHLGEQAGIGQQQGVERDPGKRGLRHSALEKWRTEDIAGVLSDQFDTEAAAQHVLSPFLRTRGRIHVSYPRCAG